MPSGKMQTAPTSTQRSQHQEAYIHFGDGERWPGTNECDECSVLP